jgi:hypothetical protein
MKAILHHPINNDNGNDGTAGPGAGSGHYVGIRGAGELRATFSRIMQRGAYERWRTSAANPLALLVDGRRCGN